MRVDALVAAYQRGYQDAHDDAALDIEYGMGHVMDVRFPDISGRIESNDCDVVSAYAEGYRAGFDAAADRLQYYERIQSPSLA